MSLLLGACGGGGGGGSGAPSTPPPTYTAVCSTTSGTCAVTGGVEFVNNGGVWVLTNTTSSDQSLKVDVSDLTVPQTMLLSLTNQSTNTSSVTVPSDFYASALPPPSPAMLSPAQMKSQQAQQHHLDMRNFRQPHIRDLSASKSMRAPSYSALATSTFTVNDTKVWKHAESSTVFSSMTTTLRVSRQQPDGKWIHFWVEDKEWDAAKITASIVNDLADTTSTASTGIYDRVKTNTDGNVWGSHIYSNLIPGSTNDVHFVIGNFDNNAQAYGVLGYFYALNNFLKSGCSICADSNEALVLFLDSETIYLGGTVGKQSVKSTLIHELVHMINYYQRETVLGVSFDSWLEEISALMMQDFMETGYGIPSTVGTNYMQNWAHDHAYKCSPFVYDGELPSDCFSYQIGSVFGAHLIRHHGLSFYQSLLQSTQPDSVQALDQALVAKGDSVMKAAARVNAVAAMLRNTTISSPYNFPALSGSTFSLPELVPQSYASYQPLPYPQPATLPSGGGAIREYTATTSSFSKTITLPKKSSLTIILKN
jgi:Peptidase M30